MVRTTRRVIVRRASHKAFRYTFRNAFRKTSALWVMHTSSDPRILTSAADDGGGAKGFAKAIAESFADGVASNV